MVLHKIGGGSWHRSRSALLGSIKTGVAAGIEAFPRYLGLCKIAPLTDIEVTPAYLALYGPGDSFKDNVGAWEAKIGRPVQTPVGLSTHPGRARGEKTTEGPCVSPLSGSRGREPVPFGSYLVGPTRPKLTRPRTACRINVGQAWPTKLLPRGAGHRPRLARERRNAKTLRRCSLRGRAGRVGDATGV